MGREIVYCWKCATRLQSDDFDNKKAFRAGDKVSCSECVYELVAEMPAEEQEAILNPQKTKKPSSTRIKATGSGGATTQVRRAAAGQTRSGATSRVQTTKSSGTGVRPNPNAGTNPNTGTRSIPKKGMTRPIPKVAPPPADDGEDGEEGELDEAAAKKKLLLIGGISGGAVIVILLVLVAVFSGSDGKKAAPVAEEKAGPVIKKPATAKVESPK